MRKKVEEYIRKNHMTEAGERVCIGLSGGADSVCLFLLLEEMQEEFGFTLEALHVNHCLRGAESDADEAFVRALCREHGIPCTVERVNIAVLAKKRGISEEEAGREARREAFDRTGADRIALAHHMDDLAETMLHNMARGTSIAGLCSLRPVRGKYIRPLLCVRRSETEEYLMEKGMKYCTDSTNMSPVYTRNRIRQMVIPGLERINTGCVEHLCSLSEDALEMEEYMQQQEEHAARKSMSMRKEGILLADSLLEQPPLLAKRVIAGALQKLCGSRKNISREHLRAVWELYARQVGRRCELPAGLRAQRTYEGVLLSLETKRESRVSLPELAISEGKCGTFGDYRVQCRFLTQEDVQNFRIEYTKQQKCGRIQEHDKISQILCLDEFSQLPVLRTRRSGDYLTVNRQGGTKKLKEYFIEKKVPAGHRDEIPLVCCGQEVLWIAGMRIGETARVFTTSQKVLLLELDRDTADESDT